MKRQKVDLTMNQTRMSQSYFPARNSPQTLNSNQVAQLIDGLKALQTTALHICQTRQISSVAIQLSVSTQHALRNTCEADNFSFYSEWPKQQDHIQQHNWMQAVLQRKRHLRRNIWVPEQVCIRSRNYSLADPAWNFDGRHRRCDQ